MTKEHQDLTWKYLPKEVRDRIISVYYCKAASSNAYNTGYSDALEQLYGKHNLTSDTKPEEMLHCSRDFVIGRYRHLTSSIAWNEGDVQAFQAATSLLKELFGNKCLPDKEEPKPRFNKGDKVFAKNSNQILTIEGIRYDSQKYDCGGYGFVPWDSSNLEPYTEENKETMEIKFNLGDKVEVDDEDDERIYTIIDILEREGDILYKLHHGECKERIEMAHLLKLYTKELMKEIKLNLCGILKGHEGKTFYCSLTGNNVVLKSIKDKELIFDDCNVARDNIRTFSNGSYYFQGECIIFPSKDQRDWIKWNKEQNPKTPKIWSEYLIKFGIDSEPILWFDSDMDWGSIGNSCSALFQIHQLIEVGYGGNITNEEWNGINAYKCIQYKSNKNDFVITNLIDNKHFIAFHTKEQAEEFLSYPENVQLLRDYYMIN